MRIHQDAWHLRLYRKAYIEDRAFWLGVPDGEWFAWSTQWRERCAEDPELRLLCDFINDFTRKRDAFYFAKWTRDDAWVVSIWYLEAQYRLEKASIAWDKRKVAEYHARRASELTERLAADRMSLCPYFWSVVLAVVYYTLILRTMNWFSRKIDKVLGLVARPIRIAALTATVFAIAFSATTYRGAIWDVLAGTAKSFGEGVAEGVVAIPTVPRRIGDWAYERKLQAARDAEAERQGAEWFREKERLAQEDARRSAEQERRAQAARIAWEREHPEEMQRRREQDAALAMMMRAHDAARTIEEIKLYAGMLWLVIGAVVIWLALLYFSFSHFWERISALFGFVFRKFGETKLGRRFFRWFGQWIERQRRRWLTFARAVSDTWALLAAFAKATKERVCPFITVVDGERRSLSS